MPIDLVWNAAVQEFWATREFQAKKQTDSGHQDAGTRGSMTGGGHLNALQMTIAELFRDAEGIEFDVRASSSDGTRTLPGYFRPTKDWDVIVLYRGVLVAAVELKSQSGSFGNNFNNRTEEAIGNAFDLRRAFEAGLLGSIKPWLGFVMLLEASDSSMSSRRAGKAVFPLDPDFSETSYLDRYRILMNRLVACNQYDAAAVVASLKGEGVIDEPSNQLSFENFEAAVRQRISCMKSLVSNPDFKFEG